MKQTYSFNHLFTLSGKKGEALGMQEPALFFDGLRAVAASLNAVMWIDCPQPEIDRPVLLPVSGIKAALLVSPTLKLRCTDDRMEANGLKLSALDPQEHIPDITRELLDFNRQDWDLVVRPFSLDGARISQLASGMAEDDLRPYLNGLYLDFASGAIVGTNGHRLHMVEDALPVVELPAGTMQGVIVPAPLVKVLAKGAGVQEVFVVQRNIKSPAKPAGAVALSVPVETAQTDADKTVKTPPRLVCFAAANAKFRVRAIDGDHYMNYRVPLEHNRTHHAAALLAAEDAATVMTVARVACKNDFPAVTITGEGRRLSVSFRDLISRSFIVGGQLGASFTTMVNANYLLDAIRAAGCFGSAITLRLGSKEPDAVYVGARDFHSLIMPMKVESESETTEHAASAGQVPAASPAALMDGA